MLWITAPGLSPRWVRHLASHGVNIEGGGAWVVDGMGIAHLLFEDGAAARDALEAAGIRVLAERDVLVQRLKQAVPGQLGMLTRRLAEASVNIEVLYSDHNNQLILVVDNLGEGELSLRNGLARVDRELAELSFARTRRMRS